MADLLPNISVTLNQVKAPAASSKVPINATIILKALSGPIGELVKVSSYTEAVKIFGLGNTKNLDGTPKTPALYGIEQYLKTYNYVNIIRVANTNNSDATNKAAAGTVSITDHATEPSVSGEIISGTTNYKTEMYNGNTIKLVYNTTRTRLSISGTLDGVTYTTPLEVIDLSTANGKDLETVLDKLVNNWNAMSTGITLENKFKNKTTSDPAISVADITDTTEGKGVWGNIGNGNSGLVNITDADVVGIFNTVIENPTTQIQDVVMAPEFRSYTVVNAGLALKNSYFYIVAAQGTTLAEKQTSIENYTPSDKGALYIPDGCKMGDDTITVPFEIAVLYAWATTYNVNRYYAPAGVKRGTMDLVTDVVNNLSEVDSETMYNGDIPANPIRYLTNYGYTIFGQKTMDPNQVFTNRINVSNLVNYIYIEGNRLLLPYLFEYTPISTFQKIYLDLDKMLSNLAIQEILYDDYQIICDTSNNTPETLAKHELHATLAIRPINVTEYIFLDLTVTDELGGEA